MRKIEKLYTLLGLTIGFSFLTIAYLVSLTSHNLSLNSSNIVYLHKHFPLHYFILLVPFLLSIIFWLIGIQKTKFNASKDRLNKLIESRTNALKESNQKLTAFFKSSSDINILISTTEQIIAFNKSAETFVQRIATALPLQEGENIYAYINEVAKPGFSNAFNIALKGKKIQFVENYRLFKSTATLQVLWLFIELQPVLDEHNIIVGVSMNIIDITKRKEIEQAIRLQNNQLKKIAWIQSHQMRKPVANILGLFELIDLNLLDEHTKEILEKLKESSEELDNYIKEIVQHTKPTDSDN